jgi:hypothetical protein
MNVKFIVFLIFQAFVICTTLMPYQSKFPNVLGDEPFGRILGQEFFYEVPS